MVSGFTTEASRDIQHLFFPVVRKGIDGDHPGAGLLRDDFGVSAVKFRLYENDAGIFPGDRGLPGLLDEQVKVLFRPLRY